MKAQALIVQFIIFFLIGLSLFISIGNFFKYQLEIFRSDTSFLMKKLISSYVSSVVISSLACKQCDFVNSSFKLQNTSLGYFIELSLSSQGLNVSSVPENKHYISSIHNFNSSLSLSGKSSSVKIITLTFDKNQNKLEVR